MEKTEKLTPLESLALIEDVIRRTHENIRQYSSCFLLWGWLMALASVSRFVLETKTDFPYYFIPFPICTGAGLIITIVYFTKKRSPYAETHLSTFLGYLWMGLAAGFIATVFVSVSQKMEPFVYTLILAGIGTAVTGLTLRFKPLVIGSFVFLLSSVLCLYVPSEYKVLINGLAVVCGYLIPGYLLKGKHN